MPADKPAPITPGGRRAAGRIRMIFYSIAAANVVFVAIVMWLGGGTGTERTGAQAKAVGEMEAVFSRALAAYNAADSDGFLACFAATDAAFSPAKIEAACRREFGKAAAGGLLDSRAMRDGNSGGIVREVSCEKQPRARLTAEFVRESGAMKLTAWRIERP